MAPVIGFMRYTSNEAIFANTRREDTMNFNDWLARKKKDFKLTNKQIAAAVDVTPSAVGRWIKGERQPERTQVARLAILFKVSPVTILRMTEQRALRDE